MTCFTWEIGTWLRAYTTELRDCDGPPMIIGQVIEIDEEARTVKIMNSWWGAVVPWSYVIEAVQFVCDHASECPHSSWCPHGRPHARHERGCESALCNLLLQRRGMRWVRVRVECIVKLRKE